jgi:hypothetical protein
MFEVYKTHDFVQAPKNGDELAYSMIVFIVSLFGLRGLI